MSREILAALAAPFPADAISWRVGSTNKKRFEAKQATERKGQALPYLDARDVMDRLDDVVGAMNWRDSYELTTNGVMLCKLEIRIDGEWCWKCDGAGSTDMEAEKGQVSDALKRAAVKWGIGRYLYSFDAPWIALDEYWRIPRNAYADLRRLLPGEQSSRRGGAPVAAQPAATAIAKETASFSPSRENDPKPIDPKVAALNKPKATTPRGPSIRDSANVRVLLLGALDACKTVSHLMDWGAENGRQSEKWPLMIAADQDAVLAAATAKLAAVRDADAKAAGANPDTGEVEAA